MSQGITQNSKEIQSRAPALSVVMSVYNGETYLHQAIESVLNQDFKAFEMIIIDDASTDQTASILEGYSQKDPRVHIVRNSKNLGLTRSLNKAISLTHGQYIARMDADDLNAKNRLSSQLKAMQTHPNWKASGTSAILIDEKNTAFRRVNRPADYQRRMRKRNVFIHGSLMFQKQALIDAKGYNEDIKYAQDYDLLLRLGPENLGWVNEPLYSLRIRSDSLSYQKMFTQAYYTALGKYKNLPKWKFLDPLRFLYELIYTWTIVYKFGLSRFTGLKKLWKTQS